MIEKKVSVDYLKPGMYISNLDRPWVDTDFLFQGFLIKTQGDIDKLKEYCTYVFIDVERGAPAEAYLTENIESGISIKVEEELPKAKATYNRLTEEFNNIIDKLKSGGKLNIETIQKDLHLLVDGGLRNNDAYLLLTKLKTKDNYTYTHCLSSSIFGIIMGKQMGLRKEQLQELALGCMFFDIGKIKYPNELLVKTGPLTDEEISLIKNHVNDSIEILKNTHGIQQSVIDVALNHHERFNGTGYPAGKKGSEIPLFARIAGIVDTYDALTSLRIYHKQCSHEHAIKELYSLRDIDFQADLVEMFIQCLGIYPTGALVELNTGEVAVVLQQNMISRLKPRIMLILNRKKEFNNYFPIINLLTAGHGKNEKQLEIIKTLEPGAYGINPAEFYL
jgi:HD-GYP domain-containing protein (c-di-GMP phosphodiesterase class II)